jgi:hypothetical protein
MKTLQEMLNDAGNSRHGRTARASNISIQGKKSGFRSDWKVPETEYWDAPGVQEVIFVTFGSMEKMGTNRLSDGTSYTKPYRTTYRFPLDQTTGKPFNDSLGFSVPCWVHCTCPAFRFYCERHATDDGSSDIIESNGGSYRVNTPNYLCKHLIATAKHAVTERRKVGMGVTADTKQPDPPRMKPKGRNPMADMSRFNSMRSDSVNTTSKTSATSMDALPQSWMGRLMYVLFNDRTGR